MSLILPKPVQFIDPSLYHQATGQQWGYSATRMMQSCTVRSEAGLLAEVWQMQESLTEAFRARVRSSSLLDLTRSFQDVRGATGGSARAGQFLSYEEFLQKEMGLAKSPTTSRRSLMGTPTHVNPLDV